MNSLAKTQEIYPTSFPDDEISAEAEYYGYDSDEDKIINAYIDSKVKLLVEEHIAESSEKLIDLAIKAYILQRKNDKVERSCYGITKKTVTKK